MKPSDSRDVDSRYPSLEQQELTLGQIWAVLLRHKKIVLALPILAGGAALVAVLLVKDQWEATGIIQIGQVGGQFGQAAYLVEPVQRSVERLMLRSFERSVLGSLDIPTDGPIAKLYRDSKRVKHLHTDLIEVRVRGYTPNDAGKLVEATVTALRRTHESMTEPSIVRLRQTLEQTRMDRDRVEVNKAHLEQALNSLRGLGPADRVVRVVLQNNMQQLNEQTRDLQRRVADLEEQLSPQRTYATSLLEDAQVSERPVSPRRGLIVVLAVLIGSILGVIAALVWNAVRRDRSSDT